MEKRLDNNGYIDFPFLATRNADGSVNPCGFDLTLETGRLVEEMNLQDGLFMTLACDWQQQTHAVCGFVDVAFRPDLTHYGHDKALQLEASFNFYLAEQEKQHQMPPDTLVNYAHAVLDWSWSPLRQQQREYEKITIQFYCPQADDAEWCFDHMCHLVSGLHGVPLIPISPASGAAMRSLALFAVTLFCSLFFTALAQADDCQQIRAGVDISSGTTRIAVARVGCLSASH